MKENTIKAALASRPVWGAWIEINNSTKNPFMQRESRAPYGARGLKYAAPHDAGGEAQSRPVWGAWIEMSAVGCPILWRSVAPRMGRVD